MHEISFYYQMLLPGESPCRDVKMDFAGQEGDVTLLFHWFRIDEIKRVRLLPTFLRTALSALPDSRPMSSTSTNRTSRESESRGETRIASQFVQRPPAALLCSWLSAHGEHR